MRRAAEAPELVAAGRSITDTMIQHLGGFADPESIPLNYYSRIPQGTTLPVLVVEGGWPSVSVGGVVSSPAEQAWDGTFRRPLTYGLGR